MRTNQNGRRLAVLTGILTVLATSGIAAAGGDGKVRCNSGNGNGYELAIPGQPSVTGATDNDCDPGNSGIHNHGKDYNPTFS
jgi:hypothetical protein